MGSGAGGAPVAHCLANHGLNVVMLERGAHYSARDLRKEELSMCRMSMFQPDKEKGRRELLYGSSKPIIDNHLWTATCVGGGTRIMSGFFLRMKPGDFTQRSSSGNIEGATHQDWPIQYSDLAHYYDRVSSDVGMSGSVESMPDKEEKFTFPPLKEHPAGKLLDKACSLLDYHPFPTPRAVLSKDWNDRGECSYSGFCGSYGCLTGAKASTHETYIKTALATGRLTLLSNYFVYKLESSGDRIVAAHYFDEDNVPAKISARVFVVACSAIETARLLLNSHTPAFPSGLANSSGQVGKNLTFTIPCEVTGFFPKNIFPAPKDCESPFVQRTIQDFHTIDNSDCAYKTGGSVVFLLPHPNPINRMITLSYTPTGERIVGAALKQKAREFFAYNHLQSDTFISFLPNNRTSVTLSSRVSDFWGIPSAKISLQPHTENIKAAQIIAYKIAEIFQTMGAKAIHHNPSPFTAGELQQGTCRFGHNPKTSVLDQYCRSHDIKNLFITDASFMPSGLPVPSTYTIMANSLRVGEYIRKNG